MKRILIVDREPYSRFSIGIALRRAGYLTEAAGDGVEALNLMISSGTEYAPFDLLLIDIQMECLSDMELIDELKKRAIDIPIFVVSGFADTAPVDEFLKKGCWPFLAKPFEPRELVRSVDKMFDTLQYRNRNLAMGINRGS